MNAFKGILKSNRGASVAAVILLISILTVAGIVFVSVMGGGIEQSVIEVSSTRALYSAEAGAETATGRLKKPPITANWLWNDGYLNKAVGTGTTSAGTFDTEVLEYENRDASLALAYKCEAFQMVVKALVPGANTARTVYMGLSSSSANNLGLQLYNADVTASCAAPPVINLVDSVTASNTAKSIRYRIPSPPATYTYTARVTGLAGTAYQLRISHPDEPTFSASGNNCGMITGAPYQCQRSLISLGKVKDARREVFQAVTR